MNHGPSSASKHSRCSVYLSPITTHTSNPSSPSSSQGQNCLFGYSNHSPNDTVAGLPLPQPKPDSGSARNAGNRSRLQLVPSSSAQPLCAARNATLPPNATTKQKDARDGTHKKVRSAENRYHTLMPRS